MELCSTSLGKLFCKLPQLYTIWGDGIHASSCQLCQGRLHCQLLLAGTLLALMAAHPACSIQDPKVNTPLLSEVCKDLLLLPSQWLKSSGSSKRQKPEQ